MDHIYHGQLQFFMRTADKGERRVSLTVSADLHSTSSSPFRKEFTVRLTDDNDPFFYYHLNLGEDDYQIVAIQSDIWLSSQEFGRISGIPNLLRAQQGLLVDFLAFPQKFADLLEMCRKEELQESPKFVLNCMLSHDDGTGQLHVVETNPFKHLVHLSLKLVAGSDIDVKQHLVKQLTSLNEQNEKLKERLQSVESNLSKQLHETKVSLSARQMEVDRYKTELHEQAILLNSKWDHQLMKEQEEASQIQTSMQKRYEKELESAAVAHERSVRQLRENLTLAESRATELSERRLDLESTIQELQKRVEILEEDLCVTRQNHQAVKQDKFRLETMCADLESMIGRHKAGIATLEHDARENEARAIHFKCHMETAQEQKVKLSEEVELQQAVIGKRESSLKMLAEEVNKGNEIIRKLQGEIKSLHHKLKLRNKVVEAQEKVIVEKGGALENLQCASSRLENDLQLKKQEVKDLQAAVESSQIKLEENAKLLKTNENVINWLNKQLNEHQVDKQRSVLAPSGQGPGGTCPQGPFGSNGSPFITSTPAGGLCGPTAEFVSRPVMQYQSHLASVPAVAKTTNFETIPEDPNSPCHDKENNPPLDVKYLQSKDHNVGGFYGNRSKVQFTASGGIPARLPRMNVAPPVGLNQPMNSRMTTKSSAYFPS